jgi:hypothetical protein
VLAPLLLGDNGVVGGIELGIGKLRPIFTHRAKLTGKTRRQLRRCWDAHPHSDG